jgi:hypothetical protein
MARASSLTRPILVASLAAGPLVFGLIVLGSLYKTLPAPIQIRPEGVIGVTMGLFVASGIGFLIALAITVVATNVMIALGNRIELARYRLVWLIVGALLATAVCLIVDPNPEVGEINVAIILSSAVCAWICRSSKPWEAL